MYQKEKLDLRTFGRTVQEAREGKGLKREKLAEMLDLSPRHTQYIETRGQHPSLQKFYEIATLFDISIDNIFFPDTTKSKTTQRRQLDTIIIAVVLMSLAIVGTAFAMAFTLIS